MQWTKEREERRRLPSMDEVQVKKTADGTDLCQEGKAFEVWIHQYACWCIRLYRLKRKGRGRKIAGWVLMGAGAAATVVLPVGVLFHAWAVSAGLTAIGGGAVSASTIASFVANGAQGIPTQLVEVGDPQRTEIYEGFVNLASDPTAVAGELTFEFTPPRLCQANGQSHELCHANV
jgi:hypothetical protein